MSPYLCPECREAIDPARRCCPRGHRFAEEDGVLVLLSQELRPRLTSFLETLRDYRSRLGKRILDPAAYDRLPHVEAQRGDFDWRLRCHDLVVVRRLLAARRPGRLLDVGSFNGWLANHLTADGHRVTAVDYFNDAHDGLAARRFYSRASWLSIQLDLTDLSLLNRTYDVVVLNRCLQFFPDPAAHLEHAQARVAQGGLLIATGLDFFRDPRRKRRELAAISTAYRQRYDRDFFLHPTRGYLDCADRQRLLALGLRLRPYPQRWASNLASRLQPDRALACFGTWQA